MHWIGVDVGGTKISAARVEKDHIVAKSKISVSASAAQEVILEELYQAIDQVIETSVKGIGIGVPSVVDPNQGIVYDVQNIPSWKEVHLKSILEKRYNLPVYVNNDVNCFALGEKYFGHGKPYKNFVGLAIGTGLGMGVVIDDKLYNGMMCGAGEVGMIPYKEGIMEAYCSGIYFQNNYAKGGKEVAEAAESGEQWAIDAYRDMGANLGDAIKAILHMLAPEAIVIGGSFRQSFHLYGKSMRQKLKGFAFGNQLQATRIHLSDLNEMATLGAAALCIEYK